MYGASFTSKATDRHLLSATLHSCLEHIINLATQAFIKTYSKSQYYNPACPDDELVAVDGKQRDVIGLVRAIAVKVDVTLLAT